MKRFLLAFLFLQFVMSLSASDLNRPNIILIMTDDQGWGQTGYYQHPVLKTPNLDAMAANGLRFDRFYAGAPNCSPSRASVMTGRSNDRTAVFNHGYPLRLQEKTIAQALKKAGYRTGHFGKWHLSGYTGPGAPVLKDDPRNPGVFGFEEWLSVTNFFDMNPVMSRNGQLEEFRGSSSDVAVTEALKFINRVAGENIPFFVVIWFGSPHSPWHADEDDKSAFTGLSENAREHYGEITDMDQNLGLVRQKLRSLGIAENTLVWFNSDNGGLKPFGPETVGGLRGWKNEVYEGGLRVPGIIEWPGMIHPRVTSFPAVTMDIFPTIAEITGLPASDLGYPIDGISLISLFDRELPRRDKPIPFRHTGRAAWIDNEYKLVTLNVEEEKYELYNLKTDPQEKNDLFDKDPELASRMVEAFKKWNRSVEESIAGKDYPGGLLSPDPPSRPWMDAPEYAPYLDRFKVRPEYKNYLKSK